MRVPRPAIKEIKPAGETSMEAEQRFNSTGIGVEKFGGGPDMVGRCYIV